MYQTLLLTRAFQSTTRAVDCKAVPSLVLSRRNRAVSPKAAMHAGLLTDEQSPGAALRNTTPCTLPPAALRADKRRKEPGYSPNIFLDFQYRATVSKLDELHVLARNALVKKNTTCFTMRCGHVSHCVPRCQNRTSQQGGEGGGQNATNECLKCRRVSAAQK